MNEETENGRSRSRRGYFFRIFRMSILLLLWVFFVTILSISHPEEEIKMTIVVMPNATVLKKITFPDNVVNVEFKGPIHKDYTDKQYIKDLPSVHVRAEWRDSTLKKIFVRSKLWKVYLSSNVSEYKHVLKKLQVSPSDKPYGYPKSEPISAEEWGSAVSVVSVESQSELPVGLLMILSNTEEETTMGVVYTLILIIALYALIITEYIDRCLGCILISVASLTLLACMGRLPTFEIITSWIDYGALMVLLGSMFMVAAMSDTGFFEYVTLVAYRTSKGHAWLLIYLLCMIAAFMSAVLDNVTVIMLLAPASIRLCEAAFINTKIVLIMLAMYANLGGSMTPMGAPDNILIIDRMIGDYEINFAYFTGNMLPPCVLCMLTIFGLIFVFVGERIYKIDDYQLERRRAMKKPTREIRNRMKELRRKMLTDKGSWLKPVPNYFNILATVEAYQSPMDLTLLIHIGIAVLFIIAGFILRSLPSIIPQSSFGWISMMAAFLLLILANKPDIGPLLAKIEWRILLYIASLFIISEAVLELGFITWLGHQVVTAVTNVEYNQQIIASMLILLWSSALLSAFFENTAVAAVLMMVCYEIEHADEVNIPLMSLIWALLLGTNFGGNGTLLASLSNEFVAAIAEDHGYKISFMEFFYMGFPIMLASLVVTSLYLITARAIVELGWLGSM
ncbi:P protein [Drosophila kikkawai]|uniref:P protein n=1 Tax=Drosophila kikkawai TaxID=30033 RepID=A0A6P4IJF8_DROKI